MTDAALNETLESAVRHHQAGNLTEAERLYNSVLDQDPGHVDALNLLAVVAGQRGELDRALTLFDRAITAAPNLATLPYNKANALRDAGRNDEARAAYEAALAIEPKYADALLNLGALLQENGETASAIATFDTLLTIAPNAAQVHYNIGKCHHTQGRLDEAESALLKAAALDPAFADVHFALANVLADLDKPEQAVSHVKQAVSLKPNWAAAYSNWGNYLCDLDQHEAALEKYQHALALDDRNANTRANYGLALLALGRLKEGWAEYSHRAASDAPYYKTPASALPKWQNETAKGADILILGEQGLGDQVFYAAMLEEFAGLANSVALTCSNKLLPVFETSFNHLGNVHFHDESLALPDTAARAQTTFVDIARHLRSSFGSFTAKSYLSADRVRAKAISESYRQKFGDETFLVGLSWASTNPEIGDRKSIPVSDLKPLLDIPNTQFVSLQGGPAGGDLSAFARSGLPQPFVDPALDAQDDLASLLCHILSLDLIITGSNTLAHLASALGKPTWVLVPSGRARLWYWFKGQDRCAWYPDTTLYHQLKPHRWGDVLARVSADLNLKCGDR